MKKVLAIIFYLSCVLARAQIIPVTATITDSDGQTWNNGTFSVQVYSPAGVPYYLGTPVPLATQTGNLSAGGSLTVSLYNTSTITPVGAIYQWSICSHTSAPCSVFQSAVTTSNLSALLDSLITTPRFSTGLNAYGYIDAEITPIPPLGSFYWNVTIPAQRIWNGTAWITQTGGAGGFPAGTGLAASHSGVGVLATQADFNPFLLSPGPIGQTTPVPLISSNSSLETLTRPACPRYAFGGCDYTSFLDNGWLQSNPLNLIADQHNYYSSGSWQESNLYEGDTSAGDFWATSWGGGNHATLAFFDNQQGGGDHQLFDIYEACNTGASSPGDEGCELLRAAHGEAGYPRLVLNSAGSPNSFGQVVATFNSANCPNGIPTQNCFPSDNSRIADINQAAIIGRLNGPPTTFSIGAVNWVKQIPTTGSLPIASAYGYCPSCSLTQSTASDIPVPQTFTLTGGSGLLTTGLACFIGNNPGTIEQAVITSVTGSAGSQTVTVPLGNQAGGIFVVQGDSHVCGFLSLDGDLAYGSNSAPGWVGVGSIDGVNEIVAIEAYGSVSTSSNFLIVNGQEPEIGVANPNFATTTAYTTGQYFSDGTTNCTYTDNGVGYTDPCVWQVTIGGTSGSSAPAWSGVVGNFITSGSVTAANIGAVTSFHIFTAARVLTHSLTAIGAGPNGALQYVYSSSLLGPSAINYTAGHRMVDPNFDIQAIASIAYSTQCLSPGTCAPLSIGGVGAGFSAGKSSFNIGNYNPLSMYFNPTSGLPTGVSLPNMMTSNGGSGANAFNFFFGAGYTPYTLFDFQGPLPGQQGMYFYNPHNSGMGAKLYDDFIANNIDIIQGGLKVDYGETIGGGVVIGNSSSVVQVGAPVAGQAACIKASGPPVILGYCSTVVGVSGACTCN